MGGEAAFDWFAFALGLLSGFALCFWLMRHKRRAQAPAPYVRPAELPPDLRAQVLRYRTEGRMIDAMNIVRSRTGCDVQTAKHLIDDVR